MKEVRMPRAGSPPSLVFCFLVSGYWTLGYWVSGCLVFDIWIFSYHMDLDLLGFGVWIIRSLTSHKPRESKTQEQIQLFTFRRIFYNIREFSVSDLYFDFCRRCEVCCRVAAASRGE